jgi:hypothetical protein
MNEMTRENKAGLVVAGVFLAVTAGVVTLKVRQKSASIGCRRHRNMIR